MFTDSYSAHSYLQVQCSVLAARHTEATALYQSGANIRGENLYVLLCTTWNENTYSNLTLVLTIWEAGSCVFISNISYIVVMQDHRKCLEGLGNNFIFSEILILGEKVAISRL